MMMICGTKGDVCSRWFVRRLRKGGRKGSGKKGGLRGISCKGGPSIGVMVSMQRGLRST